jgi:hypothetical protein
MVELGMTLARGSKIGIIAEAPVPERLVIARVILDGPATKTSPACRGVDLIPRGEVDH